MKKCVICKKPIEGYGNNAEPVRPGRCCDECNWKVVLPLRLAEMVARGGAAENKA